MTIKNRVLKRWIIQKKYKGNKIKLNFDQGVNPYLRKVIGDFCAKIGHIYRLAVPLTIFVRNTEYVELRNGGWAKSSMYRSGKEESENKIEITLSVGDYNELIKDYGRKKGVYVILLRLCEWIISYFFWQRIPNLIQFKLGDKLDEYVSGQLSVEMVNAYLRIKRK